MAKNSVLNTYATLIYFFFQWLTTIFVVRLGSFEDAGIYSLTISYCNIFLIISCFGVRTYQVSNVNDEHTHGDYIAARGVTSAVALTLFFIFLLFMQLSDYTLMCCLFLMFFKLTESCTDVFFGSFQLMDRYRSIAVSYTVKGLLSFSFFCMGLRFFHSLMFAVLLMGLANLAAILVYDLPIMIRSRVNVRRTRFQDVRRILANCFPLMLYALISAFMYFLTRYAIEHRYSSEQLGYYASVSVVLTVFVTLTNAIWSVIAGWASNAYANGEAALIGKYVAKILAGVFVSGALIVLLGCFAGEWGLSLLFGEAIVPYAFLLVPVLMISVVLSAASFFSVLLISFKKRTPMMLANTVGAVLCAATAFPFVNAFGMLGAVISLGAGASSQMLFSMMIVFFSISKLKSKLKKQAAPS
ncbi:MAG: oligosaccharide flippase family protein [Oscillospiraceae bacterium]|nr:oligosaccharide flippase family protein [Oscillospiraceae bacterium]